MIEKFIEQGTSPKFDLLIIDEAQDLAPLQWKMVKEVLVPNSKKVYYAGDDDQAIFRWAGADVDSFITLKGEYYPLKQSYRIPAKVHNLAMNIINKIKNRIDKTWKPKINEGTLQRHFDVDSIDMTQGDWLVLSRTRHMLNDIEESLYRQGLYYVNRYKRTNEKDLQELSLIHI